MCYYARVRQICSSNEMVNEYTEIFAQGYKTVDEVEQEFADAFGESYRFIDHAVVTLYGLPAARMVIAAKRALEACFHASIYAETVWTAVGGCGSSSTSARSPTTPVGGKGDNHVASTIRRRNKYIVHTKSVHLALRHANKSPSDGNVFWQRKSTKMSPV